LLWPAAPQVLNRDADGVPLLVASLRPFASAQEALQVPKQPPVVTKPLAAPFAPKRRQIATATATATTTATTTAAPAPETTAAAPADTALGVVAPNPVSPPTGPSTSVADSGAGSPTAVDGLRGYRIALASQARRYKRYPPQAMGAGWEGRADIRLTVGADGLPQTVALLNSSGHDALDRAALAIIDAGAARTRVPDSLRGQVFAVVLPVVFDLNDQ